MLSFGSDPKSQIIQSHPEMQSYIGLDFDPVAHEKAKGKIDSIQKDSTSDLKTHTFLRNFKNIKSTISEVDEHLLNPGIDGILMDLGMSSMQVCKLLTILQPFYTFAEIVSLNMQDLY